MQLNSLKLQDLYSRLLGNIVSTYPQSVVSEKKKYTTIGYAGQMIRLFICQDEQLESLVMRVSTDIYSQLSKDNSMLIYISSLDELNGAKYAAQTIMAQKISESKAGGGVLLQEITGNNQGYILNSNKEQIGVVDLSRIPTNAYLTAADMANKAAPQVSEEEKQEEIVNRAKQGTIRKFFRR